MNASTPILNASLLHLGTMEKLNKNHVDGSARYRVPLLYEGKRLVLQTPPVSMTHLMYATHGVHVPQPPWLKQQLGILHHYVSRNTRLPYELHDPNVPVESLYKSTYDGETLILNLSFDCTTSMLVNGTPQPQAEARKRPQYGRGHYTFTIEAPHIYMARHKCGEAFSLTLQVRHIHFEPEPNQAPSVDPNQAPSLVGPSPVGPSQVPSVHANPVLSVDPNQVQSQAPSVDPNQVQWDPVQNQAPLSKPKPKPKRQRRKLVDVMVSDLKTMDPALFDHAMGSA